MCLIEDLLPKAERVIAWYIRKLPSHADGDALRGAAYEALVRAEQRFDGTRGIPFEQYALPRVIGAMQDELRKLDNVSRLDRRVARGEATRKKGRVTMVTLVYGDMQVTEEGKTVFDFMEGEPDHAPAIVDQDELLQALEHVSERERKVLLLWAVGMPFKEIADIEHVTESRISQIASNGCKKMRKKMAA